MQIWAESGKSALPICNYSQILYQFLTFTQNLKRSRAIVLMFTPLLAICSEMIQCLCIFSLYISIAKINKFIFVYFMF